MNGMHRVPVTRPMPTDCGMKGMHGNTSPAREQKADSRADKLQNTQAVKIPGDTKGNNIDYKI